MRAQLRKQETIIGKSSELSTREIFENLSPSAISVLVQDFYSNGYCQFPSIFKKDEIESFRGILDQLGQSKDSEYYESHKGIGSLLDITENEGSAALISHPEVLKALSVIGCGDLSFQYGLGFIKDAHTPRTFWHQDGSVWGDSESYAEKPIEIGVLAYLQDTEVNNGSLVVIPGSHRRLHSLHTITEGIPHSNWRKIESPEHSVYQPQVEEIAIEAKAGSIVVMDMRLLHATKANRTESQRGLITSVYFNDFGNLSESIQARYVTGATSSWDWMPKGLSSWSPEALNRIKPLMPQVGAVPGVSPEPSIAHPKLELLEQTN